jgi:hypothetical protein
MLGISIFFKGQSSVKGKYLENLLKYIRLLYL